MQEFTAVSSNSVIISPSIPPHTTTMPSIILPPPSTRPTSSIITPSIISPPPPSTSLPTSSIISPTTSLSPLPLTNTPISSPKLPRIKKLAESVRKRSLSRLLSPSQTFSLGEGGASDDGRSTPNSGRSSHSQSMVSLNSLDPPFLDQQKKKWIVSSSSCDETSIKSLLKENPKLISVVDPCTGYHVLHWTAKRNNMDLMIFLLSSTVANVNATTHGGYTPLHLAAMHGHKQMFLLLMNQFMGDSSLRDNSGRTPSTYFQTNKLLSNVYGSITAFTDHKNSWIGYTDDVTILRQKKNLEREIARRKKIQLQEEKSQELKIQPKDAKFARNFGYSNFVTRM